MNAGRGQARIRADCRRGQGQAGAARLPGRGRQAGRAPREDIVEEARAREREIRLGAEDYADEILSTLEVNLQKFIGAVQRGRDKLQGRDEIRDTV